MNKRAVSFGSLLLLLQGGSYTLVGGFWEPEEMVGPLPEAYHNYLPLVLRND